MNIFFKSKKLHTFIALILISLSLTGGNCDKLLVDNVSVPQELLGNWQLVTQTGALQDICPEEIVNYQSTKVAELTCPGAVSISRDFEIENDILSYTQTSISYDVEFSNNNNDLALYGRNVSRNLFYEKIITSGAHPVVKVKTNLNNSSELER